MPIKVSNNPFECSPAMIADSLFLGNFISLEILLEAHPNPRPGSYANIVNENDSDDLAVWDSNDLTYTVFKKSTLQDGLVSLGEIIVDGNDRTFPEGVAIWNKNNTGLTNVEWSIEILPSAEDYHRTDIVVGDGSGNLHHVIGDEDLEVAPIPSVPAGMVLIKQFNVFGATIDDTVPPITGDSTVQKVYYSQVSSNHTGIQDFLTFMMPFGLIKLTGSCTEIKSLNIIFVPGEGDLFGGHTIRIKNFQPVPVLLKHLAGLGNFKFWFPNLADRWVMPNEIVSFTIHYALYRLEFIGSNFSVSNTPKYLKFQQNLTVTGVTGWTTLLAAIIPPNTFPEGSTVRVSYRTYKIGANGTYSTNLNFDTPSISANVLMNNQGSGIQIQPDRRFTIKGGLMYHMNNSGAYPTDIGNNNNAIQADSYNPAGSHTFYLKVNPTSALDVIHLDYLLFEIFT